MTMIKAKIYLKTGQCFDVLADRISCKYNNLTGELIAFQYSGGAQFPIYLDVNQVAAVVQLQCRECGDGGNE